MELAKRAAKQQGAFERATPEEKAAWIEKLADDFVAAGEAEYGSDYKKRYDPKKSLGTIVRCHPDERSCAYYGSIIVDLSPNGVAAIKEGKLAEGFSIMSVSPEDDRCPGCKCFENDDPQTTSCFCDSIVEKGTVIKNDQKPK